MDPRRLTQYRSRLSGPIKDRLDLSVAVPRQRYTEIFGDTAEEASAAIRQRVDGARGAQRARDARLNAALPGATARAACRLTSGATRLLRLSGERLQLSARAYFRVLRVARTIADLAGEERVGEEALGEALHFRAAAEE